MLAQEEVMLVQEDVVQVRRKMKGENRNLARYACLLHFLGDSGSGVSVNQFAVASFKLQTFHSSNKICCSKSLCVSGNYISRPGLMLSTVIVDGSY